MIRRTPKEILELSPEERRALKFDEACIHYEPRRNFTQEQIITYLKENDFRTSRRLMANRKIGEPTVYDVVKLFGSWRKAVIRAFGEKAIRYNRHLVSAEYVVQCVVQFKLWTKVQWEAAHRAKPVAIPSFNQIRKHYGTFVNLKAFAEFYAVEPSLSKIMS